MLKVFEKLKNGKKVVIVCAGDSITQQKEWLMMSVPLHPNEYGHKFMAQVLFQYVQV